MPCRQRLSDDGSFIYLGGSLPLPAALEARAIRLAEHVSAALPPWRGYLGIDLVLGRDRSGADDCVIEVNPRLTTSYVGLRAAYASNLALAMLDIAEGRSYVLQPRGVQVHFAASGEVAIESLPEACEV
jgi:predicted ATP-grasp superfamily ATP-dependent carboligase